MCRTVTRKNKLLFFKFSQSSATSSQNNEVNQIKGGVTIVKLNSPSQEINQLSNAASTSGRNIAKMVLSTVTLNGNCSNTVASTSSQNTSTSGHVVTINSSSITTPISSGNGTISTTSNVATTAAVVTPTAPHTGYTRRAKLGDSRSTGRLYSAGNTHRSMTRLNIAGIH